MTGLSGESALPFGSRIPFTRAISATLADSGIRADFFAQVRPSSGPGDPWLGKDKADHFMVSAFLAGTCYYFARAELHNHRKTTIALSMGITGIIGVGKELYDHFSHKGMASWKDLVADVTGATAGVFILNY